MNRQTALRSGGLDGVMTDVIALINNVQNGFNIKVTTSTGYVRAHGFPERVERTYQELH